MDKRIYQNHIIDKRRIKAFVQRLDDVFYLDSCGIEDTLKLGNYEILVGVGVKRKLEIGWREVADWTLIDQFVRGGTWLFVQLGYDLKNDVHHLQSHNKNFLQWPKLTLVEPSVVIGIDHEGVLEIWSEDPENIYDQLALSELQPFNFESHVSKIEASMSESAYLKQVEYIKHEIAKGNVYEMNLCMEYAMNGFQIKDPFAWHHQLVEYSPTPFSAYVKLGSVHLLCASPERFISKRGKILNSQPIKGTSSRYDNKVRDDASRLYLSTSEKERAEHVMIVDLVRNDLSRSSISGSVKVKDLFGVYSFAHVHQMISTVESEVSSDQEWVDIIRNTFPMGSMTGAPKHIAMQYIDELENNSRGWYSGSIGYIKPDGNFDFNVVIRSLLYDASQQKASFSVGGAITYDSDPVLEYEECQLKAVAIRRVFNL